MRFNLRSQCFIAPQRPSMHITSFPVVFMLSAILSKSILENLFFYDFEYQTNFLISFMISYFISDVSYLAATQSSLSPGMGEKSKTGLLFESCLEQHSPEWKEGIWCLRGKQLKGQKASLWKRKKEAFHGAGDALRWLHFDAACSEKIMSAHFQLPLTYKRTK